MPTLLQLLQPAPKHGPLFFPSLLERPNPPPHTHTPPPPPHCRYRAHESHLPIPLPSLPSAPDIFISLIVQLPRLVYVFSLCFSFVQHPRCVLSDIIGREVRASNYLERGWTGRGGMRAVIAPPWLCRKAFKSFRPPSCRFQLATRLRARKDRADPGMGRLFVLWHKVSACRT